MKKPRYVAGFLSVALVAGLLLADATIAQGRRGGQRSGAPGTVSRVVWSEDGKSVDFTSEAQRYRFNLETRQRESLGRDPTAEPQGGRRGGRRGRRGGGRQGGRGGRGGAEPGVATTGTYVGRPTRGRQYTQVDSPDGQWEAH